MHTNIILREAGSDYDYQQAAGLFQEYARGLGIDLEFQGFTEEIERITHQYGSPYGTIILVFKDDDQLLGCAGVRKLEDTIGELKRMYVRPEGRGLGIGRTLLREAVRRSQVLGYHYLRLDTLPTMESAISLYESEGFYPIAPYRHNPIPGARYYEKCLKE